MKIRKKVPPADGGQGQPGSTGGLEKGGLEAALKEAGVTGQTVLAWGDEMRAGLCGQTRRVWAPWSVKIRQRVQMERKWHYLALAVQPLEGRLSWCWIENLSAESIATALQEWEQDGIAAVVVDRASGHRSAGRREEGIVLIFQPPTRRS